MAMRVVVHVDMDAFFASVEMRDRPELRGKPVIVGGASRRGVVAAASYEVRKFGVHSAMPMVEALRRCPDAIVVSPKHGRYGEVSAQVFEIFRRFTPLVEGLSLDEAFLDVTASLSLFGTGEQIARAIKDAIRAELRLTASAGVASNKFVAKIASDLQKPDGLVVVAPGEVAALLAPLPIERMWGVGQKTSARLRSLGFATFRDLAEAPDSRLTEALGNSASRIRALARGEDDRPVVSERDAGSIGAEETFETDLSSTEELERALLAQAARVAKRLTEEGLAADTITVKLKTHDFKLSTRQLKLPEPASDTDTLFGAARILLQRFDREGRRFRLTGLSAGGLAPSASVRTLFPDQILEKRRKLEQAVHGIDERFPGAVTRATLLGRATRE